MLLEQTNWSAIRHVIHAQPVRSIASQEEKLSSWFCFILHLRHCWEEKTQTSTRQCCKSHHVHEDNSVNLKMFIKNQIILFQMLSVILHLRHCWEEKTQTSTRQCCKSHHVHEDNSVNLKMFIKKSKWFYWKCSSGRKFFPVWCCRKNNLLRRGSIILISRGLRGGSNFKSE